MSFLAERLRGQAPAIAERWLELIAAHFAGGLGDLVRRGGEQPFHNPVGHVFARETAALAAALADGMAPGDFQPPLRELARVLAVQDLPAEKALGFAFLARRAVREAAGEALPPAAAAELEARVDALALAACAAFLECREELSRLRVAEVRRRVSERLARLAGAEPGGEVAD